MEKLSEFCKNRNNILVDGNEFAPSFIKKIEALEKEIEQLKISNMGDEYDEAEAERFRSEYERQICEAFYKWLYDSEEFSNFDKEYKLFKSKEGGK